MTAMWPGEPESEAYDDSDVDDYDSEGDNDSEETTAARQARARRILVQRRMLRARSRQPRATTIARAPTPRQTVAAIRNLDLENKVGEDSLRRAIDQANQRAARATYAAMASIAVDQALDSFRNDLGNHDIIRAGLRVTPLLLLSPQRKRGGFEGIALDPRVIGVVGVGGVLAAGKFRNRKVGIEKIDMSPTTVSLATGAAKFLTIVRGKNGASLNPNVTFKGSDDKIITVAQDGSFTPQQVGGPVKVEATADGFSVETFVTVVA